MTPDKTPQKRAGQSLASSFERYLQDKGKGRSGEGGNYRRNAARELERFAAWAAGDRGRDDWTGIVPDDVASRPRKRVRLDFELGGDEAYDLNGGPKYDPAFYANRCSGRPRAYSCRSGDETQIWRYLRE